MTCSQFPRQRSPHHRKERAWFTPNSESSSSSQIGSHYKSPPRTGRTSDRLHTRCRSGLSVARLPNPRSNHARAAAAQPLCTRSAALHHRTAHAKIRQRHRPRRHAALRIKSDGHAQNRQAQTSRPVHRAPIRLPIRKRASHSIGPAPSDLYRPLPATAIDPPCGQPKPNPRRNLTHAPAPSSPDQQPPPTPL